LGIIDAFRSKIGEANEVLASAKKSWQDDSLARREQELTEHERRLVQRKAEFDEVLGQLKALESNRFRRIFRYCLIAVCAAIPSYVLGVVTAQSADHNRSSDISSHLPQEKRESTAALSSPADAGEQQQRDGDQSSSITTSSGFTLPPGPIALCARRGVAYFIEIGSYPTLSSAPDAGRPAEDVAIERCSRTTTAF